ncbi:MAG: 3-deoxy-8-phosphooctulonate synthase, partial [candidate division Zixibacteria bacterium]|nr:3-deoxy-8-phosphooctulonate synthase [candidate division Zixibacteria bacterium]
SDERFFLIAGPCVAESLELCLEIGETVGELTEKFGISFIFKASYSKANRLSGSSYSGPGLDEGLRILQIVKERLSVPILTDVHETSEVGSAADVADIIQIPAFLCRQTELIRRAAATGKWVNIKKGQFLAPEDMAPLIDKAGADGANDGANKRVMVTERGTTFGYHNLVVDFRSLMIMRKFGVPVVFDATHSLQLPGADGHSSGGRPEFTQAFCRAALAIGVDGLFIETHPNPSEAKSDSKSMIPLAQLERLLEDCVRVSEALAPSGKPQETLS